jgi:NAD(P)H-hydrate epimerase
MKILTSRQMSNIDGRAIKGFGIPGIILMENAGIQAMHFIMDSIEEIEAKNILILCGTGNNGGDGFVVARHLYSHGLFPEIKLIGEAKKVKGDALTNLKIAKKIRIPIEEIKTEASWRKFRSQLTNFQCIIDALLGTGLQGAPRGIYKMIIEDINQSLSEVVAIDIPSGLSGDTYKVSGAAVEADYTITFCCPKIPHVFPPAENYIGELEVADINIPDRAVLEEKTFLNLVEKELVYALLPQRRRDDHKGHFGHALVVSGSRGKSGAASLVAMSALKAGAGLVTVAAPDTAQKILATHSTEMMTEPIPETKDGSISTKALPLLLELAQDKDLISIGPGITRDKQTASTVRSLVKKTKIPVLIDADGLNAFEGFSKDLFGKKRKLIITPHPGEMSRLIGQSVKFVQDNRVEVCRNFAVTHHCYVVLKGYKTLISDPTGQVFVNPTGNPGLGTAGAGDILTGIMTGFLVQGIDILHALILSVYLHGFAADIAAGDLGEIPLMAGDVIDYLPDAIMELSDE